MTELNFWNLGDILDAVGAALGPEDMALIHGERRISWPDMTARSNRLARNLLARGAKVGDKAGFYMRNQPEYMEGLAACFKGRLTHVNVNYRYLEDELFYIFDNSDSTVVFFDVEFMDQVEKVQPRLPNVVAWVQVGGGKTATSLSLMKNSQPRVTPPRWVFRAPATTCCSSTPAARPACRKV
jgi:acyl-CoA synthetase (AMP-forming)/AMP-acid ligase II